MNSKSTGANAARTERVQELRRSGAAGKHGDSRSARLKTRAAVKKAAIRDQA